METLNYEEAREYLIGLIQDYKVLKPELNRISKELSELYDSEENVPSLKTVYNLEDKAFSALIDALCVYQDICVTVNRMEETEDNRFELKRLHRLVDSLEEIKAEFFYDILSKNNLTEVNDGTIVTTTEY